MSSHLRLVFSLLTLIPRRLVRPVCTGQLLHRVTSTDARTCIEHQQFISSITKARSIYYFENLLEFLQCYLSIHTTSALGTKLTLPFIKDIMLWALAVDLSHVKGLFTVSGCISDCDIQSQTQSQMLMQTQTLSMNWPLIGQIQDCFLPMMVRAPVNRKSWQWPWTFLVRKCYSWKKTQSTNMGCWNYVVRF